MKNKMKLKLFKQSLALGLLLPLSSFCLNAADIHAQDAGAALSVNEDELRQNQFVTLTFHDVRDDVAKRGDRDVYAISTQNLGQFFAWIKREGWQPIRLNDVMQARLKQQKLPEKALMLTFDDGALSSHSKVFPLLKEYNYPAVFAIPTSWINGNTKDAFEAYGAGNLMTWDQMREMQKSGLAEFVSHSDNMHRGILANPQQNMEPAAITRQYFAAEKRYENDTEFEQRIVADLKKSKQELDRQLGINSLAIFWPYGAVTPEIEGYARQAGLPMSFSLGNVVSLADSAHTYQRALIMDNPMPEQIHQNMDDFINEARAPYKQRKSFLGFNLAQLQSQSTAEFDQKLGQLLDQVSALKSNTLLLQTAIDHDGDGKIDALFFPNSKLPMQQDLLNRTVWQARTRISNRVYAELPINLELQQGINLADLTADLMKNNSSLEGLVLDAGHALDCAVSQTQWSEACMQQVKRIIAIKERSKAQAHHYSNISNDNQTALKLNLKGDDLSGLQPLVKQALSTSDFLYLSMNPVQQPETFKAFVKAVHMLDAEQKQRLIVSLDLNPNMSSKDWKRYQKNYQTLRSASIQKIGINNYQLNDGERVQCNLYQNLSLNGSPLTYRDPYLQGGAK
ncbi:poly-beta-1,6-N-acetyl-D-glucosamine N-deacetylase PgaB [Acinetobacter pragensis]|uniref:Poly-beta-1,6-N-acetyl-D-glucosamine N-deacetylase PgaB n=1 Tax=Acinetobacter pragensis TaxID=1806892 RepID=A0A151XXY2_9GAMM|nr:poly-beta-1,6-N-acetyl-D-glucosamine N-deacetylase PgaB [Acinetobacter pragensis]KYQ70524.1 poly-beta-1,6-N-acetyl-D-glucosamine N-deacetylase PgaB [Acinetobacter pragensis]